MVKFPSIWQADNNKKELVEMLSQKEKKFIITLKNQEIITAAVDFANSNIVLLIRNNAYDLKNKICILVHTDDIEIVQDE